MTRVPAYNNLNQFSIDSLQEDISQTQASQLNSSGASASTSSSSSSEQSDSASVSIYNDSLNHFVNNYLAFYPMANSSGAHPIHASHHLHLNESRLSQKISCLEKELNEIVSKRMRLEKVEREMRKRIDAHKVELRNLQSKCPPSRPMNGISSNGLLSVFTPNSQSSPPVVNGSRQSMYVDMPANPFIPPPPAYCTQSIPSVLTGSVTTSSQFGPRTQNGVSPQTPTTLEVSSVEGMSHSRQHQFRDLSSTCFDSNGVFRAAEKNKSAVADLCNMTPYIRSPLLQDSIHNPYTNKTSELLRHGLSSSVSSAPSDSQTTYSNGDSDMKNYVLNCSTTPANEGPRVATSLCPSKGKQLSNVVQFKSLPLIFDCIEDELMSPRISYKQLEVLSFSLTADQYRMVREYQTRRILLRICYVKPKKTSQNDRISRKLIVRVNTKLVTFGTKYNNFFKAPLDITPYCLFNGVVNEIELRWSDDASKFKEYGVGVFFVRRLSVDETLQVLKENRYLRSSCETIKIVQKKLSNTSDICSESMKVPLTCPITKQVLQLPCVGLKCEHLSCFDARPFLMMSQKKNEWICPLCKRQIGLNELKVDGLIGKILDDTNRRCNQIEFDRNGTWKPVTEAVKEQVPTSMTIEDSSIDVITIEDSDDEVTDSHATVNDEDTVTDQTEDTEENETESSEGSAHGSGSDETDKIQNDDDDDDDDDDNEDEDTDGSSTDIGAQSFEDEDYVPGRTKEATIGRAARPRAWSLRNRRTPGETPREDATVNTRGKKRKRRRRK